MKLEDLNAAVPYLTPEEQELLLKLGDATGQDGVAVAVDMDIRHGLATALGDMGSAVQLLLTLLTRHQVALPEKALPAYDNLLRNIAGAASNGAVWVGRSHEFDQSALLALTPEPCPRLQ